MSAIFKVPPPPAPFPKPDFKDRDKIRQQFTISALLSCGKNKKNNNNPPLVHQVAVLGLFNFVCKLT